MVTIREQILLETKYVAKIAVVAKQKFLVLKHDLNCIAVESCIEPELIEILLGVPKQIFLRRAKQSVEKDYMRCFSEANMFLSLLVALHVCSL